MFQILEESLQGKVLSDEELKSIDLPSSTQAYAKTLHPDFFSYLSQHQVKHVLDLVHKANKHGTFECELIRSPSKDSVELLFVCPYPHSKLVGHILDLFSRRNLVIKRMSVSYVFAQAQEKILALACDLHGNDNMLAWDVCDMQLLIQELFFLNDFEADDVLYPLVYVEKKLEPIEDIFQTTRSGTRSFHLFFKSIFKNAPRTDTSHTKACRVSFQTRTRRIFFSISFD